MRSSVLSGHAGALNVTILDDGPGFLPEIIDTLGEPYVTTRPAPGRDRGEGKDLGLGLGFFIAKTLLERSGAKISLENRTPPLHGAAVRIVWPRGAFDIRPTAERGLDDQQIRAPQLAHENQ